MTHSDATWSGEKTGRFVYLFFFSFAEMLHDYRSQFDSNSVMISVNKFNKNDIVVIMNAKNVHLDYIYLIPEKEVNASNCKVYPSVQCPGGMKLNDRHKVVETKVNVFNGYLTHFKFKLHLRRNFK